MKKLTILAAFAALAMSASAASITWGFGGQVYVSEDGSAATLSTSSTADMTGWCLALVYVGQNKDTFNIADVSTSSIVNDENTSSAATLAYKVATTGKNAGKWDPTTITSTTTAYADGASFAVVWYDGASNFDYIYSGTTSVGSAVTSATSVSDMSARGSASIYGTGGSGTAGVVAVPEPSVALMGLLGIGMLLKRRRA